MTDVSTSVDRRLFIGGERLRISIDAPPAGGGEKYEPQTPEQARELLMPMMEEVAEAAAVIPSRLRGERIYVEARLLPNYLAASHFPEALLTRVGAVFGGRPSVQPGRFAGLNGAFEGVCRISGPGLGVYPTGPRRSGCGLSLSDKGIERFSGWVGVVSPLIVSCPGPAGEGS